MELPPVPPFSFLASPALDGFWIVAILEEIDAQILLPGEHRSAAQALTSQEPRRRPRS